jgi:ribose transport system substrate-binding protein
MQNMIKPSSLLMAAAVAGSALTLSCGEDDTETTAERESLTIAWIPKEKGNEVFQVGLDGAKLKALELTETTDYDVEILYLAPETAADIEGQKDSVQEAIDAEVDAIAISCSSPDVSEMVDKAIDEGIPTMSWDSDCRHPDGTQSKRFTYYGIDNRETGQVATQLMEAVLEDDDTMEPPYRIAILSGVPVATNLQERVAGVWDELKEMGTCRFTLQDSGDWGEEPDRCWPEDLAPEDATFHIYRDEPDKCQNTWDKESCATIYAEVENEGSGETLEEVVERDRDDDGEADLNAVILIGLWPLFAYDENEDDNKIPVWTEAMEAGTLHTITYDTLEFQIDMARDGLLDALVGQKYWGWGYEVLQMVYDKLVKNKKFDPDFTNSGEDIVCPNNFAAMDNMWSSGDFTQELPDCELLE